jgi:hypothetical protein
MPNIYMSKSLVEFADEKRVQKYRQAIIEKKRRWLVLEYSSPNKLDLLANGSEIGEFIQHFDCPNILFGLLRVREDILLVHFLPESPSDTVDTQHYNYSLVHGKRLFVKFEADLRIIVTKFTELTVDRLLKAYQVGDIFLSRPTEKVDKKKIKALISSNSNDSLVQNKESLNAASLEKSGSKTFSLKGTLRKAMSRDSTIFLRPPKPSGLKNVVHELQRSGNIGDGGSFRLRPSKSAEILGTSIPLKFSESDVKLSEPRQSDCRMSQNSKYSDQMSWEQLASDINGRKDSSKPSDEERIIMAKVDALSKIVSDFPWTKTTKPNLSPIVQVSLTANLMAGFDVKIESPTPTMLKDVSQTPTNPTVQTPTNSNPLLLSLTEENRSVKSPSLKRIPTNPASPDVPKSEALLSPAPLLPLFSPITPLGNMECFKSKSSSSHFDQMLEELNSFSSSKNSIEKSMSGSFQSLVDAVQGGSQEKMPS